MEKMNVEAQGKEEISNELVEKVLASVIDTAEREGVDSHLLLAKVYERSLQNNEKTKSEEPESKRQKLTKETDQQSSSLPEKAWGIFLLNGLKFLPNNFLFPSFSLLNSTCQHEAKRELAVRCKERHPSLFAAVEESFNENQEVLLSLSDWQRFELDEAASRAPSSQLWPAHATEAVEDIDVLLQITKGDDVICHGMTALTEDLSVSFPLAHFSFDAPLPEATDEFTEDDPFFPGHRTYAFWCGREDCSVEQKTLCKALYGEHSSHLTQRMPSLHVRVVLRRRSNGQMVTIISSSVPNQILGEDYSRPIGSYEVHYHNGSSLGEDRRFFASVDISVFCSPLEGKHTSDSIAFSTRGNNDEQEHAELDFRFDICDVTHFDSLPDMATAAMRNWFN